MIEPKTVRKRRVSELAAELDCTPAAIYAAIKKGYIQAISVGAGKRITEVVFQHHAKHGYGPNVPPYSQHSAETKSLSKI